MSGARAAASGSGCVDDFVVSTGTLQMSGTPGNRTYVANNV